MANTEAMPGESSSASGGAESEVNAGTDSEHPTRWTTLIS